VTEDASGAKCNRLHPDLLVPEGDGVRVANLLPIVDDARPLRRVQAPEHLGVHQTAAGVEQAAVHDEEGDAAPGVGAGVGDLHLEGGQAHSGDLELLDDDVRCFAVALQQGSRSHLRNRLGLHGAGGSGGLRTSDANCGACGNHTLKNGDLNVSRHFMQLRNDPRCFAKREEEQQHARSSKG
jgi:hypothetical protein